MIAFLASFLLVAYLLAPPAVFRLVFSFFLPLKKFQRTRGEEITFAAVVALVPLCLAVWLVWQASWFAHHPFGAAAGHLAESYKQVFEASYSEQVFRDDREGFWQSLREVGHHQATLLFWYYLLLALEALVLGSLSRAYGQWHKIRAYRWCASKILLPSISEWHVLLTPFALPSKLRQDVMADVLTSDDHLYRGAIANHFVDSEGKLTGLLLKNVIRFDRATYLKDKQTGMPTPSQYWKPIPGQNVYVFADKITNINLSYQTSAPALMQQVLQKLKVTPGIQVAPVLRAPKPPQAKQ